MSTTLFNHHQLNSTRYSLVSNVSNSLSLVNNQFKMLRLVVQCPETYSKCFELIADRYISLLSPLSLLSIVIYSFQCHSNWSEFIAIPVQLVSTQSKCPSTRLHSSQFHPISSQGANQCSRNVPDLQQMCRTYSRSYILLLSHLLIPPIVTHSPQGHSIRLKFNLKCLNSSQTQSNAVKCIQIEYEMS